MSPRPAPSSRPPPKKNTQTETQQDTRENIKELLKLVREHLSENIIGQPDAINAIMRQFKNFLVGIANPVKPIASLIFAGFTGAGKTELAKQLAIILGFPILRLDMSEFHKDHEVARLIGAPPGYIGHDEGGKLTNFVKEHPRSVIIFDEIEKADPRINDILLQIVEEGTLTDGKGNTVSLHTCFVIITTNIGAREAASNTVGFTQGDPSSKINDFLREIKKYFRPELLGRIGLDNVIVFNQLSAESLTQITKLEFKKIAERTLQFHGIKLRPTKSAVQQVQQTSNSNLYGARDLGKTIEKHVLPGLADFLLEQDLPPKHAISVSYNPKTVSYNFKIVKK